MKTKIAPLVCSTAETTPTPRDHINPTPVGDAEPAPTPALPWQRQPGEPARWFGRFEVYRRRGCGRSLDWAWRTWISEAKRKTNKNGRAPDSWHHAAKRWAWPERALAWDVDQAEGIGEQVLGERVRRLRDAVTARRQRGEIIVSLEDSFRGYVNDVVIPLSGKSSYRPFLEECKKEMEDHFRFVERLSALSRGEYAAEEKLLAEVASRQQVRAEEREGGHPDSSSGRLKLVETQAGRHGGSPFLQGFAAVGLAMGLANLPGKA